MALTNAERQARHRERQKEKLRNAAQAKPLRDDVGATGREIEALKRKLTKAEETIAEKEAQRLAQENRASIAAKQAGDAANRAMFAEADKERLAHELAALRNAAPTEAVLAWLRKVDRDDEDREAFLRNITYLISDWFVPTHWYDDCAAELHIARGTPIPEGLAKKRGALRNA